MWHVSASDVGVALWEQLTGGHGMENGCGTCVLSGCGICEPALPHTCLCLHTPTSSGALGVGYHVGN